MSGSDMALLGEVTAVDGIERFQDPVSGLVGRAAKVTVEVESWIYGENQRQTTTTPTLELIVVESVTLPDGGGEQPSTTQDARRLLGRPGTVILGRSVGGTSFLAGAAFASATGSTDFAGSCTPSLSQSLARVSELVEGESEIATLTDWLVVHGAGGDESKYLGAASNIAVSSAKLWLATAPTARSLTPDDVPAEWLSRLDVRAAVFELSGIPDGSVVVVRTASGVSGGISPTVASPVLPAYFVEGADQEFEIAVADLMDVSNARVVASIAVGDTETSAGFRVSGAVASGEIRVEPLSATEVAARLGVDADDLERIRTQLLTPANEPTE
jgi:hypothetical protein